MNISLSSEKKALNLTDQYLYAGCVPFHAVYDWFSYASQTGELLECLRGMPMNVTLPVSDVLLAVLFVRVWRSTR